MQQHITNESQQNTPEAQSAVEHKQSFVTQTWSHILRHAKQVKPAALVIALFLAMTFTFAIQGDLRSQTLSPATLPVDSLAEVKPDTVAALAEATPDTASEAPRYIAGSELKRMSPLPPQKVDNETLWLARVIYSETKRPEEQELVAWVIRNRKDTEYRGKDTYQEVANDPYQFSAFIPGTSTRSTYTSLTAKSQTPGFQKALAIAHQVMHAPDSVRPFPETTRHFYSPQSMVGGRTPAWAVGKSPVAPTRDFALETQRFRFYEDIG